MNYLYKQAALTKLSELRKAISHVLRCRMIKQADEYTGILPREPDIWGELDRWVTPSKYRDLKKNPVVEPGVYHASSPVFGNIPGTGAARHSQIFAIMNNRPMTVPYVELDNGQFAVNFSGSFGVNPKELVTSYPVFNDKIGNTKSRVPSDLNAITSYIHPNTNKYYTYTTMQSGEAAAQDAALALYDVFKQHRKGSGQYNPFTNNCNSMCAHAAGRLNPNNGDIKYPEFFGGTIGGVDSKNADQFILSPNGLKYPLAEPKPKQPFKDPYAIPNIQFSH